MSVYFLHDLQNDGKIKISQHCFALKMIWILSIYCMIYRENYWSIRCIPEMRCLQIFPGVTNCWDSKMLLTRDSFLMMGSEELVSKNFKTLDEPSS